MSRYFIVHIPHSGVNIPKEYLSDYLISSDELKKNIFEYCDLYTDELFFKLYENFGGIKSEYSRLFFDPERFLDDDMEEMQKKYKLGWFYENAIIEKKPLRITKNKDKIRYFYDKHHQKLNTLTKEKLTKYNKCTILDCHSFSDRKYWFLDKNLKFPDICIGFDDFHIDIDLVDAVKEIFQGYEIKINTPYSGSLVPLEYWQKDKRVKSVMIEINKRLYLKSDNITKSENFSDIEQRLNNLYEKMKDL